MIILLIHFSGIMATGIQGADARPHHRNKPMTPDQETLVRETWQQVRPIASLAMSMFYDRLFEIDPGLRRMFARTDMVHQHMMLAQALETVVGALGRTQTIVPSLQVLARRHARYGVEDRHYEAVGAALLWTLAKGLGAGWTTEVEAAWTAAYASVAGVMQAAACEEVAPAIAA
jgi:hemoglobin-like flavoprotein